MPSPDGLDTRWRIVSHGNPDTIEGLYHLRLSPTTQYDAAGLVITAEDMELRMSSGAMFVSEIYSGVTGMVLKLVLFRRAQVVSYALYPIMGWAAVLAAPALAESLTPVQLALVIGGGLSYTIGLPVLLVGRPNPWPTTFGYHEVWHLFTVLAATLHFAAVTTIVV